MHGMGSSAACTVETAEQAFTNANAKTASCDIQRPPRRSACPPRGHTPTGRSASEGIVNHEQPARLAGVHVGRRDERVGPLECCERTAETREAEAQPPTREIGAARL